MRKRNLILSGLLLFSGWCLSQPGQVDINRIKLMPSLPSPYLMRNWKDVTAQYDQFVFSATAQGQYLPLLTLKPSGINYPNLTPILLQSYVGSKNPGQAEAISIIPAIVGASLMGIDKSDQFGNDWVSKVADFFNSKNGENVYLNGYTAQSGGDWWYDVMPNIFFYQLYDRYPNRQVFKTQAASVADQWLKAVQTMGGKSTPWSVPQMNYRGWKLANMTGNPDGVKQPEAAGSIGWILYHAYKQTGEKRYLYAAQQCLEFLSNQPSNPSYELQLPYGALTAAKMNAELGTGYDIEKLVNWTFDRGALRGWGAIIGKWNGSDVHGLIGEANDTGNDYAFAMNGFQQAAALAPLMKYDKRFTRSIAKWILNLANASRLFYPAYLPQDRQDDYPWSSAFDSRSVIAYEGLREKNPQNNQPLFGTGDARKNGWANTNLGVYGSSSVGYLAAVTDTTDVPGILKLDLNKTDFFSDQSFPTFVLYNPHPAAKQVTLALPEGTHDIYEALREQFISSGESQATTITINPDEAMQLVLVPAGTSTLATGGKLLAGEMVVDHHYGYDFSGKPRIKALAAADTLVSFGQQVPIYLTTENLSLSPAYKWSVNGTTVFNSSTAAFTWTVPAVSGRNVLQVEITSGNTVLMDSIAFNAVASIPKAPEIQSITSDLKWYPGNGKAILTCSATDTQDSPEKMIYEWTVTQGSILSQNGNSFTWQLPAQEGIYEASCKVTDTENLSVTAKRTVLVKANPAGTGELFFYFPLDGDTRDYSGNNRHATASGLDPATDARGQQGKAYLFNSGGDLINLSNTTELNIRDKITVTCWINMSSLSEEAFIISHGSWEERWKISVTPAKYLRWTVKTGGGIRDLDSSKPIETGKFYHVAAVYTGYSMELYIDGELDVFREHSGLISETAKSLTIGRKDESVTRYSFFGTIDEARLYRSALGPADISPLKTIWNTVVTSTGLEAEGITLYPNPVDEHRFTIRTEGTEALSELELIRADGTTIGFTSEIKGNVATVFLKDTAPGMILVRMRTNSGLKTAKLIIR